MANSYKAIALREELASDLAFTLSGLARTKGFDASGNPTLLIGTGAAGSQSAFIRIKQLDSLNQDILGLSQNVFTPHVIQVVLEASTVANCPLLTIDNLTVVMGELMKRGVRLEVYLSANTNAPEVSDITAGNLKQTFNAHVQYPLAGQ